MRNDLDLDLFYQAVRKESDRIDDLNEPVLPRKRLQPNFSILQFRSGHEEKSDPVEPYNPTTVKELQLKFNYSLTTVQLQLKNTLKLFTLKLSILFITH